MNTRDESSALYSRATAVMPGGVNSPVRAFRSVGMDPVFAASAKGPYLTTVDGDQLIDFIASWGALILGHAEDGILDAVEQAVRNGSSFGVPTGAEVELAELVIDMVPSVEIVRLVNSGTEATASAIRVARAATGRPGVIKFEGCYHGHADPFLVRAGSGAATFGIPDSPGVTGATVADTHVARFNDLQSVESALERAEVAAIIIEPVAGNMGVVPPAPGFLEGLRSLCDREGALLIFDEVMTGFRVGPGGAQSRYGVTPDLTCLGKIVAGGTPAAAYGGREDLMRSVAPDGPVYQAGTLAGNPIATAAGLACLHHLQANPGLYETIESIGQRMESALEDALGAAGIEGCVQRVGGMMTLFLGAKQVSSWDEASTLDRDLFASYFRASLERGVLLPPSPFEAMFLMTAHESVVDEAVSSLSDALASLV